LAASARLGRAGGTAGSGATATRRSPTPPETPDALRLPASRPLQLYVPTDDAWKALKKDKSLKAKGYGLSKVRAAPHRLVCRPPAPPFSTALVRLVPACPAHP
jgi:hypothetical protein